VKYDVTLASGGEAVKKGAGMPPAVFAANNIGLASLEPGKGFFSEGGPLSKALNQIPGLNAVGGLHDYLNTDKNLFMATNIPTMPLAAGITYTGLLSGAPSVYLAVDRIKDRADN